MLKTPEMLVLWKETSGRLPSGGRWWFRVASVSAVKASRAFFVEGRGWMTGPHCLPRDKAELTELLRGRAALLRRSRR